MQKQKGFTLIELIVVIAIIAILAAIVTVRVTGYIRKTKIASATANMNQLSTMSVNWQNDPVTNFSSYGFAGFCSNVGYGGKVLTAINDLNLSEFVYECYDYFNNGANCDYFTTADGSTRWFAYYHDEANDKYFCVDFRGTVNSSTIDPQRANYDDCSCL